MCSASATRHASGAFQYAGLDFALDQAHRFCRIEGNGHIGRRMRHTAVIAIQLGNGFRLNGNADGLGAVYVQGIGHGRLSIAG